jgi:hypothetical protein
MMITFSMVQTSRPGVLMGGIVPRFGLFDKTQDSGCRAGGRFVGYSNRCFTNVPISGIMILSLSKVIYLLWLAGSEKQMRGLDDRRWEPCLPQGGDRWRCSKSMISKDTSRIGVG